MRIKLIPVLLSLCLLTGCQFFSQPVQQQTVITFTFDDGMDSVWDYAMLIFDEFGYKATNFVSSGLLDQPGYLTWEQVESLEFQKGWETGGHSLLHYDLCFLDYAEVDIAIGLDYRNLRSHGLDIKSFAVPSGQCPTSYMDIISSYYRYIRTSVDNPSSQPINEHLIGEFPYRSNMKTSDITNRILDGIANHENLIIIGFHSVKPANSNPYNCTPDELRNILTWVQEHHLQVRTLKDAMHQLNVE